MIKSWKSKYHCSDDAYPLASIVLTTFNQKELAILSLHSILNQDYQNLEIVISDDTSTDGLYEELVNECQNYASTIGRHSIILNRNEENLGICKNYEKGVYLSSGEIIVIQGGDDIAHPNRVSSIIKHWIDDGKKATVIFHKLNPIDIDGKALNYEWWHLTLRNPIGAAMAYTPVIKEKFDEIEYPKAFEDNIFARRAYMFGDVLYLNEKIIDYRVGSGLTSSGDYFMQRMKICSGMIQSVNQNRIDLKKVKDIIPTSKFIYLDNLITEIYNSYQTEYTLYTSKNRIKIIRAFIKVTPKLKNDYLDNTSTTLDSPTRFVLRLCRKFTYILSKN